MKKGCIARVITSEFVITGVSSGLLKDQHDLRELMVMLLLRWLQK
jgi:hypothetical protein